MVIKAISRRRPIQPEYSLIGDPLRITEILLQNIGGSRYCPRLLNPIEIDIEATRHDGSSIAVQISAAL